MLCRVLRFALVGCFAIAVGGWAAPSAAACTLSTTNPSVTICTPANSATVPVPVHVNAGTTDSHTVTTMKIFVDGVAKFFINAGKLDTYVGGLANGPHTIMVQATDSAGVTFSSSVNITVSGSTGVYHFKHIIFLLQENRSLDNYFGRMGAYRTARGFSANFDSLPLNVQLKDVSGQYVSPFHYQTVCTENLTPSWNESHYDVDGGKMDNFMITTQSVHSTIDPDGTRAMGYYDWNDLPYYYALAFNFATSDRFFSSVLANTIPNRMYMFAATSFGHIQPDSPPSGGWPVTTIFDRLRTSNISWKYYYQDNSVFLAQWAGWSQGDSGHVFPISQYFTDLTNGTLPSVVFIERAAQTGLDEHPDNNVQKGAADVENMITKLMQSSSWASSLFILGYDEGGGLYDHVVPATLAKPDNIPPMLKSGDLPGTFTQSGFRVPIVIVSPYTKAHFVSHKVRDLTSILRLIEERFGLYPLTNRDASADDMQEFFDFSAPHLLTPPALPTQPTSGTCNYNLEKAPGH